MTDHDRHHLGGDGGLRHEVHRRPLPMPDVRRVFQLDAGL